MDVAIIILGLLAIAGIGFSAWLAVTRSALVRDLGSAIASIEHLKEHAASVAAEADRLRDQLAQERQTITKLSVDRAALAEQLDAERQSHQQTRSRVERDLLDKLASVETRAAREIAHVESLAKEKLEAVQRERDAIRTELAKFDLKLREVFASLATDALKSNQSQFLALAEQKLEAKKSSIDELVKPIAETLSRAGAKLAVIEQAGQELRAETGKLVRALREPHVRGRYGELQLRRVAELAGMSAYCDFAEQHTTRDADGVALRPDMIVKLPSSRTVVVDAKTNIQAYLDAMSASSAEEAEQHLARFARHVAEQVSALARKKYWREYDGSPEFVVMFIPGDQFIDAALRQDADLLNRAAEQGVILAGPATLIGLLRAVAVGYREQQLAQAAEELRDLGKELHERFAVAMSHASRLGKSIASAVESYNDFVGSYEKRLQPVMKRFEESGVKSAKDLPEPPVVETKVRVTQAQQLPLIEDRSSA